MGVFTAIAVAATVTSVAGQISQAKAQKKAAQNQAALDQANAELAEMNAEAQALGIEKQTEFNLKEIGVDRSILGGRTDRELAGIYQISRFQTAQAGLDNDRLLADAGYQAGVAARQTASDKADLQAEIAGLVAQGDYERAVLVARGESGEADLIDEIAALDADVGFAAEQRREEAAETLRRAGAAVVSIQARNAYEQASLSRSMEAERADAANKAGSLDLQRGEALNQVDDAGRAMARNEAARALEQQQLARSRDRVMGAARAAAAKSGVALDGSAMDVMMDLGLDATSEMVRADLAAAQRTDNLSAEMRGRNVQAELYGREAAGVREQSGYKLDQMAAEKTYRGEESGRQIAETTAQAQFDAGQLTAQADNLRRQADEKIKTLERHRSELSANINRDIEYAESNTSRLEADARRKISDVEQKGAEAQDYMARRFEIDKAGLKIESDYAGWQLAEQVRELEISTAEQVAALDREADMTRWRGETEAANMRDYGTAQAQVLRQSAAATLSAGKSAYSTAMFGAGATLLRGGYNVYDIYSGGALTALTQPKTGGTITTVRP